MFTDQKIKRAEEEMTGKRFTGTVECYNRCYGYGFVKRSDNDEILFAHHRRIVVRTQSFATLDVGETIEFEIVPGEKKHREAINITGPGGAPVLGNRYEVYEALSRFEGVSHNNDMTTGRQVNEPNSPINEANRTSTHYYGQTFDFPLTLFKRVISPQDWFEHHQLAPGARSGCWGN